MQILQHSPGKAEVFFDDLAEADKFNRNILYYDQLSLSVENVGTEPVSIIMPDAALERTRINLAYRASEMRRQTGKYSLAEAQSVGVQAVLASIYFARTEASREAA